MPALAAHQSRLLPAGALAVPGDDQGSALGVDLQIGLARAGEVEGDGIGPVILRHVRLGRETRLGGRRLPPRPGLAERPVELLLQL